MDMDGAGMASSDAPLSPAGVDFSNDTQAADFLSAILDDDELKIVGNDYARYFWYGVAVVVGIATLHNFLRWVTLRLRLRAAARKRLHPARPANVFTRAMATITALARESTYLQYAPTGTPTWLRVPPMGTILLILGYLAFVLALEFVNNDVAGAQFWQARGVRAGWLAVAQIPLLILLANKNNLIGALTGTSYERLNILHRWTARVTLLMAIFHFGYQSFGWQQYGLMKLEWATDSCPPTGIAAFALLLWMNLSTLAPFRHWSYEFFVCQHIITFFGFIIAIIWHLPSTALWSRIYIYIPIALYLIDRLIRTNLFVYFNLHAQKATLTALDGDVTKIRLPNPALKSWRPGSFVLLSIPQFGWIESHPATIVSTPRSHNGDLVFLLKSHKGFTRRLMKNANTSATALLPHTKAENDSHQNLEKASYRAFTNGPYGGAHADFAAFDSVCLFAGSTGISFTLAILQDLADRASVLGQRLPLRRVHFVWCVRSTRWTSWCREEIAAACGKLTGTGVEARVSVFVTCTESLTEQGGGKERGCRCEKSAGPCCCVRLQQEDGEESVAPAADSSREEKKQAAVQAPRPVSPLSSTASTSKDGSSGTRLPALPCATFFSGRPGIRRILADVLDGADGESAVGVCGPVAMSAAVRNNVVALSDERAIHKGTGAQGCYLFVESFS